MLLTVYHLVDERHISHLKKLILWKGRKLTLDNENLAAEWFLLYSLAQPSRHLKQITARNAAAEQSLVNCKSEQGSKNPSNLWADEIKWN
jgi:hypothetical protein